MRRRPADTHSEDATQTQGNAGEGGGEGGSKPPLLESLCLMLCLSQGP